MIIPAKYGGENCFLNTNYIVDVFLKDGHYLAYVLDADRESYEIDKETFANWIAQENRCDIPVSFVNAEDMGRYDHYTDTFIK